ncbi:MAG: polysaccharide deacetylase family protein [Actinomycetota bacterium]
MDFLKNQALRAVKVMAAGWDGVKQSDRGIVVLLYHRVGGTSGLQVDLEADLFARQMEALAEQDRVVTVDAALRALTSLAPPEPDPVVVTFDDGTADFADVALPILERFGIPATVYVATDFVERRRPFPNDGRPMSWAGLREAITTGLVTVGSHTHTHALLDRLPAEAVDEELDRSAALIEDRLGVPAHHFAYPKAVAGTPAAEVAVRRRFSSAALGGNRANAYGRTDPHRLARSSIQTADGMHWFRRKLAGGLVLEETLRRKMNRFRYAGAAR